MNRSFSTRCTRVCVLFCLVATVALTASGSARAADHWLQWGGPRRDFMVESKGLKDKWPDDGPPKLWDRELGDGYSTILADNDALYSMYRVGEDEFTVALDAKTGKTLWEHKNPSPTTKTMLEFGPGPHSTPLLLADRLYTVGANMDLYCFQKKSGEVVWKHDLIEEFGAKMPEYGYAASPIEYKNTLILPVGGKAGQSLMAFDPVSGKVLWQKQDFEITYSSPIVIRFQGQEQLVYFTGSALMGFNPADGETLWSHPHKTQYDANIMTPVWDGTDTLFCSAAYDSGARAVQLTKEGDKTVPKERWFSKKMRLHHGNAVHVGGYAYGSSGDFGPAFFMAVNLKDGEIAWRERGFKKTTCVFAGNGTMILLDEDGQLALAKASPEKFTLLSKCKIGETYAWAAPTLVGTKLYVRDRKHIVALELG